MSLPTPVHNQLLFLIAEVCTQLQNLQLLMNRRSSVISEQVMERAGHSYNLKLRVHAACLEALRSTDEKDIDVSALRAVEDIATKLEHIASLCQDCARQTKQLESRHFLKNLNYKKWLIKTERSLQCINKALFNKDTDKALKLGTLHTKVNKFYRSSSNKLIKSLKKTNTPEDSVTALFIARHILEISEAVQEISEAIISINVGQSMPLERYRALRVLIENLDLNDDWRSLDIKSLAETRSGSAISAVIDSSNKDSPFVAVFKDGQTSKVLEEQQGVKQWHKLYPGIAPQILSHHTEGETSALMIEHLPGDTFENIVINGSDKAVHKTLKYLTRTLDSVWTTTKKKEKINAHHCQQLKKRLMAVYGLHPEFESLTLSQHQGQKNTLSVLLEQAQKIENNLSAPFSVYIHGDLNIDNIIYDRTLRRVYFIDLHRSKYMDYVQDIAVFIVSNYRLPIHDDKTRQRIDYISEYFFNFSCDYAKHHNDKTFQLRLALGLVRSLVSSTRFTLDKKLAHALFLSALTLLHHIINSDKKSQHFTFSIKDILNVST